MAMNIEVFQIRNLFSPAGSVGTSASQRCPLDTSRVSPAGSVGASASQRCPLDTSRPYSRKAAPTEPSLSGTRVQGVCSLPGETLLFASFQVITVSRCKWYLLGYTMDIPSTDQNIPCTFQTCHFPARE